MNIYDAATDLPIHPATDAEQEGTMSILKSYEEMPYMMPGATRTKVPISNDGSHYLSVILAPKYFDGYNVALLQPWGIVKHPLISSGLDDVARLESVEEVDALIEQLRLEWGYKG